LDFADSAILSGFFRHDLLLISGYPRTLLAFALDRPFQLGSLLPDYNRCDAIGLTVFFASGTVNLPVPVKQESHLIVYRLTEDGFGRYRPICHIMPVLLLFRNIIVASPCAEFNRRLSTQ
jgi:hypothetical protein